MPKKRKKPKRRKNPRRITPFIIRECRTQSTIATWLWFGFLFFVGAVFLWCMVFKASTTGGWFCTAIIGGLIALSLFIKLRYPLDFEAAQIELNAEGLHLHYVPQTILWKDILKCTYHIERGHGSSSRWLEIKLVDGSTVKIEDNTFDCDIKILQHHILRRSKSSSIH